MNMLHPQHRQREEREEYDDYLPSTDDELDEWVYELEAPFRPRYAPELQKANEISEAAERRRTRILIRVLIALSALLLAGIFVRLLMPTNLSTDMPPPATIAKTSGGEARSLASDERKVETGKRTDEKSLISWLVLVAEEFGMSRSGNT
jgi:hypothetical protein